MTDGQSIPPAWYPDPADSSKLRYWDGAAWTEKLLDRAAAAAAMPSLFSPPPAQAAPAVPSSPAFPSMAVAEPTTSFTGYERGPFAGAAYVPLARTYAVPTKLTPAEGSSTISIWLWTLVPLLLLTHVYFPWEFSATDFINLVIHAGLGLAYLVLAILLAAIDRSRLSLRGYTSAPPAILGVLPPLHILARLFAVGAGGILVTFASLLVQAAVAVVLLMQYAPQPESEALVGNPVAPSIPSTGMVAPFSPEQAAYLLTTEGMAAKLRYDSQPSEMNYLTVVCEPLPSTDLGVQTTCAATGRLADYSIVVQVLPSDTGGVPFTVLSVVPEPH